MECPLTTCPCSPECTRGVEEGFLTPSTGVGCRRFLIRMVLICFLLEDSLLRQQGVHGQAERERDLCGAGLPHSPSLGAGQRQMATGHPPSVVCRPPAPWIEVLCPWGCSPLSPLAFCMWASSQLPCFFLMSVLFTVTTCPQGRGGPALPTKPAVYTARGRLCADKGDLLVRESACSPALLFWGPHLGAPFLLLALLLWPTLCPVSLPP